MTLHSSIGHPSIGPSSIGPRRSTGAALRGCGHHAPARIVTNTELEALLDLEPGWIERRTGIRARHWAGDADTLCSLAVPAARQAMAHTDANRIGMLVLATSTPDQPLPPTAPRLAHALGLAHAGAVDMAGACCGFVQALALADGFVRSQGRSALVVGANILSRRIDPADRTSAVLFADAAGAVLLEPCADPGRGVIGLDLACDGGGYDLIGIPDGTRTMRIRDGQALFTAAVQMMTACGQNALRQAGIAADALAWLVPHQANARIMERVRRNLGIDAARVMTSIREYGNASAGTIPLTLSLSHALHPLQPGDLLLLTAAGAGMMGAGLVLRC